MVQMSIFPKADLRNDHTLIVEQKLRGKMDLRALIEWPNVGYSSIATSSSWPDEGLDSRRRKGFTGEPIHDCSELLLTKMKKL